MSPPIFLHIGACGFLISITRHHDQPFAHRAGISDPGEAFSFLYPFLRPSESASFLITLPIFTRALADYRDRVWWHWADSPFPDPAAYAPVLLEVSGCGGRS